MATCLLRSRRYVQGIYAPNTYLHKAKNIFKGQVLGSGESLLFQAFTQPSSDGCEAESLHTLTMSLEHRIESFVAAKRLCMNRQAYAGLGGGVPLLFVMAPAL